jgi:hypothetical protein
MGNSNLTRTVKRTLTVRRDFTAGQEPGSVEVARDCGIGCTCGATIYKTEGPSPRLAEDKTLCFNDATREGISELPGTARLVPAAPGVTAYEVQAELVQYAKT